MAKQPYMRTTAGAGPNAAIDAIVMTGNDAPSMAALANALCARGIAAFLADCGPMGLAVACPHGIVWPAGTLGGWSIGFGDDGAGLDGGPGRLDAVWASDLATHDPDGRMRTARAIIAGKSTAGQAADWLVGIVDYDGRTAAARKAAMPA